MSRQRTYGDVTVTFATEQAAKDFDAWLDGEEVLYIGGKEMGRWKTRDNFDPYKFFGIKREDDAEE